MRWGTPAIFLAACAALVGCSSIHTAKLVPPAKFLRSVVSLSPSTTDIIQTSTVSNLLKGRTAADTATGLASVPVVASVKPDYEAIKKINPDLVLYDGGLYNSQDIEKIKALGFPTFALDANTVDGFEKQLYSLADTLGSQTNTEDYIDRIEVAKNTALASKPTKPLKVAVIMPGNGGADMIDGSKSFVADVISIGGGTPVGPPVDRFVPLNPETLVSDNPDVIFFPATDATAAADAGAILHDPKLMSTNAVKNKRIVPINSDVLLRRGNAVDKLIGGISRSLAMGGKA